MRKKKAVTVEAAPKAATGKKTKAKAKASSAEEELREHLRKIVPKTAELTHIAAVLAQGTRIEDEGAARSLARQVLCLWDACWAERYRFIERQVKEEIERRAKEAETPPVPRPAQYPVNFDEFLRLHLPVRSKADREHIFREFVREGVRSKRCGLKAFGLMRDAISGEPCGSVQELYEREPLPDVADEEVVRKMEEHRKAELDGFDCECLSKEFSKWLTERASETARKAAKARWREGDKPSDQVGEQRQ